MEYAFKYGLDPLYKYQVVTGMWEDTPAGLQRVTLRAKTYQDTDSDQIPDRIAETVKVNNKATALVTDTLASTRTLTSPVGRTVTTLYDPDTLLTNTLSIPGLFDTAYGYDTKYNTPQKLDKGIRCKLACHTKKEARYGKKHTQRTQWGF